MRNFLETLRENAWVWLFMLCVGFVIGKQFTYANIVADCRVLGMFRVAEHPFDCRMTVGK